MAETTKKRRKRIKINYGRLAILVLILVLVGTVAFNVRRIISLHAEKERLIAQREELEQVKQEKLNELENVNDLDYIEEQARKQLKMIKPGEVLFVIDETVKEVKESQEEGQSDAGTLGSGENAG
ncbi:MAG: septum formation initiator family protein [Firmicutes bacterium]|nr:septum formation initiator family protein [Bacillota bacterium]